MDAATIANAMAMQAKLYARKPVTYPTREQVKAEQERVQKLNEEVRKMNEAESAK